MQLDLGELVPVTFHTHEYLNFGGFDHDAQKSSHWFNGRIRRDESKGTAKRQGFSTNQKRTVPVTDRVIYLFADHDLVGGKKRIHVCAVLYADPKGNVSLLSGSGAVETGSAPWVSIPNVIDGKKLRYFALASKVQMLQGDLDTWIQHFDAEAPADPGFKSNVAYQIGFSDFNFLHTFLGFEEVQMPVGTDENGEVLTETMSVLKLPVLDPLQMANRMADRLRTFLRQYEREFGFHKTLINESSSSVSKEVNEWAKYRLAVMLHVAAEPNLKKKVEDLKPGALSGFLNSRIRVQESFQTAVDLAAGNLSSWLSRDVVLAWINLNHFSGVSNVSIEPSAGTDRPEPAKICIIEDFGRAIRDLHQTRPGNLLAEQLHKRAAENPFLDEYLFSGGPMEGVLKTGAAIENAMDVKKLVFGRLIARNKANLAEVIEQQALYLRDAGVIKSPFDFFTSQATSIKSLIGSRPGTLPVTNLALNQARIDVESLRSDLGGLGAASSVMSMLGWLSVMEGIRVYADVAGKHSIKDHLTLSAAIAAQSLATTELLLGETLKKASKTGLRLALSAMGVVVNVVDAGLRAKEADEMFSKGDTDAGLLTAASAVLIIYSIPFGLMGLWIGAALAVIAGLLGVIAGFVKNDTWDDFLENTPFGKEKGGGSKAPDWAGVSLDGLKSNTALQVRALARLLNNFSVVPVGGGSGDRFGPFTLKLAMATPDPMAVFLLTWQFEVSGESGVQESTTVASTFTGSKTPADGKNFRVPGVLLAPDGKTSLETFEHAAVKLVGTSTLHIGDPFVMRRPGRQVKGRRVFVRRLLMQSFGRPRSEDLEWTHTVEVDLSLPPKEAKLFVDA